MTENRVYVIRCGGYQQAEEALRSALAQMGGMERFVKPGERILLKANLLRPAPPEMPLPLRGRLFSGLRGSLCACFG